MWMAAIVAFITAILSGLGIGSAGLFVLWLTFVQKISQITAQGINLIFFLFSSGAALIVHAFRTPLLWKSIFVLVPLGLLGSIVGVHVATALPQDLLRRLFGLLLIISGTLGLFGKKKQQLSKKSPQVHKSH